MWTERNLKKKAESRHYGGLNYIIEVRYTLDWRHITWKT